MPEEKNDPEDEKKEDPEHGKCQKPPEPEAGPEKEMSEEELNESVAFLNEAFAKLKQAMAEAKANGFYVCDRPLVECPHCGLMEDAVENDRLVTFFKNDRKKYTNMRFEELETGYFLCPNCSKIFHEPYDPDDPLGLHEEDEDDDWS
ncbi:MAG: hypothetical protein Q7U02_09425 [Desulfosalsimonadaceae bacterium]|nr:hypothetical protein [Desulfosalsimonadaceae bacterium]